MANDGRPVGRGEAALVLAAALGVVVVLVLIVFVLIGGNDETQVPHAAPPSGTIATPGSTAGSTPSADASAGGSVTTLKAAGASGRCLPPSADLLAGQDLAFDATVVGTERSASGGETVTLQPTRFFTGDETDEVEVQAPGKQLSALLDATTFTDGDRYLVAATDGKVAICGLSAPYSADLEQLYEQAFG